MQLPDVARITIKLLAVVSIAGCDSATGPDSTLAGQYELRSIEGDPSLAESNPDGSTTWFYGLIILRNDGSYSYAVMTRTCQPNQCTPMSVKSFGGTWTGKSSDIVLYERADGTVRRWHYSDEALSGREPKFFDGSHGLVFRKCGTAEAGGCEFYPGT